ncbi:HXXEE domain-containing protein [Gulosibacter sp. 10]|uniref:HXXEE domain-containing protein n=1 Tax=Gulosibacter sp. 10 TaxID=1255570 RepID=UPI00097F6429|nr:HXXEE domain-containing protein [Gulosibacter sp. 10]SJM62292.1 integral membrane protein [Gulosibacter sp. 10]
MRGPGALFAAWTLHDVEEAVAFPQTCDRLADRTGAERLRMDGRQSWAAVGMMAVLVGTSCLRGERTRGRSRLYRAVLAGLEAHVGTHLIASAVLRGYTAGVATAVPVMLPGAVLARRELERRGAPLRSREYAVGAAVLIPAALLCHLLARLLPAKTRTRR